MRSKEVEEAIKRIEQLHNGISVGIILNVKSDGTTCKSLETVLAYIEELEAKLEFKQFGDLDSLQFENTYLDKQVIRDKIKEIKDYIEEFKPQGYIEDELNAKISVLKELLGE